MRLTFLLVAVVCWMSWAGCNTINPSEKIPNYVHIDSFRLAPFSYGLYGSASHKISCVFAYFNNNPIGVFDLPATIPVIVGQPGTLTVVPGVDMNGLRGFETSYPFYTVDSLHLTDKPAAIDTFSPKTTYSNTSKMLWSDDFNGGGSVFTLFNGDSALIQTVDPTKVFEGKGSGYIHLVNHNNGITPVSENVASNVNGFKANPGTSIYIELDYKCSVPFQVGLSTTFSNGDVYKEYVTGFKAHPDSWNKVYLNVQDFVNANEGIDYRVIIRAGLDNGESEGWVLLDNIKVISF